MTDKPLDLLGFTTAAPGWRLWIVDPEGEPKEVAFAGWVTLEDNSEYNLRESNQVICPGWLDHGEITTAIESGGDVDVWVVGPDQPVPTADELRDWGAEHAVKRFRWPHREPDNAAELT